MLSDDQKKRIYDQYGEMGLKNGMGDFTSATAGMDFTNPFDLFESFFGGGNFFNFLKNFNIFNLLNRYEWFWRHRTEPASPGTTRR